MFALRALCCVFAALSGGVGVWAVSTDSSSNAPTTTAASSSPSSTVSSRTSTSSGPATVTIAVGAEGFAFTPHETKANVGDVIRFNFYPTGHRVVRAAFGRACIPYELLTLHKKGFDSGAKSPQVVTSNPPHFDVTVNDTDPIFYYCAAPGSCVNHHMIGVINPNETQTYAEQLKFAKKASFQLAPGEPWPSETLAPGNPGPYGTLAPSPRPSSSSSAASSSGGSSGLSSGAIAGIVIGAAAVLVLAAALIYLCGRRGGFDKAYRKWVQQSPPPAPALPDMVNHIPRSPGAELHASMVGAQTPYLGQTPSPYLAQTPSPNLSPSAGQLPGHGFVAVPGQAASDSHHAAPRWSVRSDQYKAFVPTPAELSSGEVPAPTQSPSPGYQGRSSWQEGQHRPGGNP